MDDIAAAPSRARKFWTIVGSVATVYAMLYGGSAIQTKIDLCGGTNATAVATYHFAESVAQPVIDKIRKA